MQENNANNKELNDNLCNQNSMYQQSNVNNGRLLKIFIGKNYKKITTKKFSFSGLFFGGFYILYRKMFLYGGIFVGSVILLNILSLLVNNMIFSCIILILQLGLYIACGIFVNKLYVDYADEKIDQIVKKDSGNNSFVLEKECHKKGGTMLWVSIVSIVFSNLIINSLNIYINYDKYVDYFNRVFSNTDVKDADDNDIEYSGYLFHDNSSVINDEFKIMLPSEFVDNNSNEYNKIYRYNNSKMSGSCKFLMFSPNGYNDASGLIRAMARYYKKTDNISSNNMNGITWYTLKVKNQVGTDLYAAMQKGEVVFMINYKIESNKDYNKCEALYYTIMRKIYSK